MPHCYSLNGKCPAQDHGNSWSPASGSLQKLQEAEPLEGMESWEPPGSFTSLLLFPVLCILTEDVMWLAPRLCHVLPIMVPT